MLARTLAFTAGIYCLMQFSCLPSFWFAALLPLLLFLARFFSNFRIVLLFFLGFFWAWFSEALVHIWEPLLLGCFILGVVSSLLTYLIIRLIWRLTVISKWEKRRKHK